MNGKIDVLQTVWHGADATMYIQRYRSQTGVHKLADVIEKGILAQVVFLRLAAEKYERTQQNAITRATVLPK